MSRNHEDDERQRVEDVHDAHHHAVDLTTEVTGDGAVADTDGEGDKGGDQADQQRDLAALDDAAKLVASKVVSAKCVLCIGRCQFILKHRVRVIIAFEKKRPDERQAGEQQDEYPAG